MTRHFEEFDFHDFENDTIKKYEGFFLVGYVDSQNKFGAIVRSYYICSAYTYGDGDSYNVMVIGIVPKSYILD